MATRFDPIRKGAIGRAGRLPFGGGVNTNSTFGPHAGMA